MAAITDKKTVSPVWQARLGEEASILKALAYFDIFHYPLTLQEITRFMDRSLTKPVVEGLLQQIVDDKIIFQREGFYSLHHTNWLVERRKEGNLRARRLLPKGYKIGRFLSCFPFVRAVCISGSLSKHFADEKADIDFFIITKANRLWLCRTIMHLFKKLTFLSGHQHYFCMNYYIDEKALLIEAQNIFTAVEITTLLPVYGKKTMNDFFVANRWTQNFFPGSTCDKLVEERPKTPWIKTIMERIFNNKAGDKLEQWLFNISTRRWQRKAETGKRNKNGRTMNLVTGKHFARSNPGAFQEKVLSLYEQKLKELKIF